MDTLFKAGANVYDANTGQTGTLLTGPYTYQGPRGGEVVDVAWDNGEEMTVYASHLHTFKAETAPKATICLGCRLPEDNCICGTL